MDPVAGPQVRESTLMSVEPSAVAPTSTGLSVRHVPAVADARPRARRRSAWTGHAGVAVSELVLVVVFMAGLIVVSVWAINGINSDTATTNCETALRNLKMATEQYHAENDAYPVDKGVLIDLGYVEESEVSGWHLDLSNAVTPTYTGTGSCG